MIEALRGHFRPEFLNRLQEGERSKLVQMESRLGERVMGQRPAIEAVRRARADGAQLLKEEVTEEDIARVVSAWAGDSGESLAGG